MTFAETGLLLGIFTTLLFLMIEVKNFAAGERARAAVELDFFFDLLRDLHAIRKFLEAKGSTIAVALHITFTRPDGRKEEDMIQITDVQKVKARLSPIDAAGNPAQVQAGSVSWASSDPAILSVTPNPADEMEAEVVAIGPLGSAQVQVSADADLGDGVKSINGIGDVQVIASEATTVGLAFDAPEGK